MSARSQGDPIREQNTDGEVEISSTTCDHDIIKGMVCKSGKPMGSLPDASYNLDPGNKTAPSHSAIDNLSDKPNDELGSSFSKPMNEDAVETEIGSVDQTTIKNTHGKDMKNIKPEEKSLDSSYDYSGELNLYEIKNNACYSQDLIQVDAENDSSSIDKDLVLRWEEDDGEFNDSLQISPTDDVLRLLDKELEHDVESENRETENQCDTDKPMETSESVTKSVADINLFKDRDNTEKQKPSKERLNIDDVTLKEESNLLSDCGETKCIHQNTYSTKPLENDGKMAAITSFEESKKNIYEIDKLTKGSTVEVTKTLDVSIPKNIVKPGHDNITNIVKTNIAEIKIVTGREIQSIASSIAADDMDIDEHFEVTSEKQDQEHHLPIDSVTTKIALPNEPETLNVIESLEDESVKKVILQQIDEIPDTSTKTQQNTIETRPKIDIKEANNVETDIDMETKQPDKSGESETETTTKRTDINDVVNNESIKLKSNLASNHGTTSVIKDQDVTIQEILNDDQIESEIKERTDDMVEIDNNESVETDDKRHINDIDSSQLDSVLETTINPNIHHRITKPNIMLDIPTQDLSDIEAELDYSDSEFKEIDDKKTHENVPTDDSKIEATMTDSVITQKEVTVVTPSCSALTPSKEQEVETTKLIVAKTKIDIDVDDDDKSPLETSVETSTSNDDVVGEKTSLLKSAQVEDVEKSSNTDLTKNSGVEITPTSRQNDTLIPLTKAVEIYEIPTTSKPDIDEKSSISISKIGELQPKPNSKQKYDETLSNSKRDTKLDNLNDTQSSTIKVTEIDTVKSAPNKKKDEASSIIMTDLYDELSMKDEVDKSLKIVKETDEMPSRSNKGLDEASSKKKESDEMPSTSKKGLDESLLNKEISIKNDLNESSSLKKETDEVPSTSNVNEKLISDNTDEVHISSDSLGLLAESFRVMDDDEGDDDDADDQDADDNDEDEDFDPYEEINSQVAEDLDSSSPTPGLQLKDAVEPSPRPQESDEGTMDVVDDIEYVENELPEMDIPDDVVSETPSNDENVEKEEPEIIDADEHVAIPPPQKIKSILEKVLGHQDANKETASKSGNVLNYVEIEGSSDSDDVQEVSKFDAAKDDVVSVNIPKGVEVMSTSAGSTSEILSKGDEVVISGVPKPYAHKKTTINTSEVTIKTKPTSTPAIEIPEKSSTIESKTPINEESINLDSDDDETETEKEDIPIVAEKEETTEELTDKKCLNPDCSNESTVYYDAPRATAAFYSLSKRGVVCEQCRLIASARDEALIEGIKDLRPLLELEMDAPSQQLVEISDSESEDDGEACGEVVGQDEAKFIEEQLADMINATWTKYNLDSRLKDTEAYLLKELEEIEASAKEIDAILNDCQKSTDEIRLDFYKGYEPRRNSVGAITIHDTPFSSYSLNERDLEEPIIEGQSSRYPKRKSSSMLSETPAKKPAIPLGGVPLDNKAVQSAAKAAGDQKIDDDKEDIKVVKLSAEAAPADLPPCGEIVRAPIKVGMTTYAMRNAFGTWLKGKVQDILPKTAGQLFTQCRVKFEHKNKNPCKLLAARCLAYPEPSEFRMTIGTRLIAMFKDQEDKSRQDSFSSGVVAEIPNPVNNFRYLVFFDHGYAQYVHHRDTRLVCESSPRVWEEVHPFISDFIYKYLLSYPERPMVRLHTGEKLKTEWSGKWWDSKVMQVDASLALIHFDEDNRSEWIYRGSTRLAPLFLELEAAQKAGEGRGRSRLPRSKAQMRSNMPCVEYTREDAPPARPTEPPGTQNEQDMRRQRSVAKKSTTQAAPATPAGITGTPFEGVISRVVYYTPKNAVKPYKMATHTCSVKCKRSDVLSLKDLRTYNPLAKPLLSGWERQTVRHRGHKAVMYRAPCGRRLRSVGELHRYLRALQSDLPVDLFDFTPGTHCLAEFVLNKCIVGKKDLSHGKENVPVPCVNYYDDSLPEFCSYNTERTPTAGVPLNLDPDFLCGCDCTDDCRDKTKCACWKMTLEGARTIGLEGSNIGYEYRRLLEPLPSGIYECNSRCKCKQTCLNRVAQHPLQLKLQVFKTVNRGWGIRALNDIPKGAFICIYAGNLLTDATANLDGVNEGDEYLAELDYIEVVEAMKEGYEDDVPEKDKKLDKKSSASENESESSSESEEERDKTEDGDFQPGYIPQPKGQVYFKKSLRKREKAKKKEEKAQMAQKDPMKKREDTITISDDEEVREPSRFTAEAGMGDMSKHSSRVSVRTLFGKDEACYIMDAKVQGNIGRYLNHSCHPNVFVQNVFVDTHDPRFPWVAFFSLAAVRAGTELTWNYNYDIGSVPDKVLYCYCGAPNCRGRLL